LYLIIVLGICGDEENVLSRQQCYYDNLVSM